MWNFDSFLFWYKLIFVTELIVSEILFVYRLRKRKFFALRATLCVIALYALAFGFPIVAYNAAWGSFMFISLFAVSLIAIKVCFSESFWNVLFCGIAAYTTEHIAYVLASSIEDIALKYIMRDVIIGGSAVNPYLNGLGFDGINLFVTVSVYVACTFVVYWISYCVYADKIRPYEDFKLGRTNFIVLAGAIILVDVVFNMVANYNANADEISLWLNRCYNLLSCILAMQLQFMQLRNKEVTTELSFAQQLIQEQRRQYEIAKQNADMINIKCHDLKHQIRTLRNRNAVIDKDELTEIEHAVSIYQSVVETGNEALNLILTEKSLLCEKQHIKVMCIADGARLMFMRPSDIYSLFGNALDNAIEAVSTLEESKRIINLSIKQIDKLLIIHIENYYDLPPVVKNGKLVTTKEDKTEHGYGMFSMKTIVEKYGGILKFDIDDNTFGLNIMFFGRNTENVANITEKA